MIYIFAYAKSKVLFDFVSYNISSLAVNSIIVQ